MLYVYHRTLEKNVDKILTNGLDSCFRNNGNGYTQNNLLHECDKALDSLNENLSLNKPKRLDSNFAWLSIEDARRENIANHEKQVILKIEIDPSTVFVSHQMLWSVAYKAFLDSRSVPKASFEEIGVVYWLNVINLNIFLRGFYRMRFTDTFDKYLKEYLRDIWEASDKFEVIIPNRIESSMISIADN